ncbi:MAG: DUF5117 domain-containing protein, partial [Gemmatimonadales bacterium]
MFKPRLFASLLGAAFLCAACAGGAHPSTSPAPAPGGAGAAGNGGKPGAESTGPKPYGKVITAEATSDSGLFIVHRVKDKWYFEIPVKLLGREMLLVTRQAQAAENIGYGGEEVNDDALSWERVGDRILMRVQSYDNVAADSMPMALAVRNSNYGPIVGAFEIAAWNKDSSNAVIDVSGLYSKDVPFLGLSKDTRDQYKITRLDESRTFIKWMHVFPTNIEVRVVQTYAATAAPASAETGTVSVEMNHSMV